MANYTEVKKHSHIFKVENDPDGNKIVKISDSKVLNVFEVTPDQLKIFRLSMIPYFVLKCMGKLYCAHIKETDIISLTPCHYCFDYGHSCARLRATEFSQGGCLKVLSRNRDKVIERFPFIDHGFQTFGTKSDSFVVYHCVRYKKAVAKKPEKDIRKLAADYLG